VLRSSVALSAILRRPIRVHRVRAGRPKPGLAAQHKVSIEAAATVSRAKTTGVAVGSSEITFTPPADGELEGGDWAFDIGSAGSTSLVLQTVIPILLHASSASRVRVRGGTHNGMSPPFEFLRDAFLPQLAAMGARVELRLLRHGFYPAGGGSLEAVVQPWVERVPLSLRERGEATDRRIRAVVSNLPPDIARREADAARAVLGWKAGDATHERVTDAAGPGNFVQVTAAFERVTEVTTAFGERGVKGEDVARDAADAMGVYLASTAPVSEHLADQLLLPLALGAGGDFCAVTASLHFTTNATIVGAFLGEGTVTWVEVAGGAAAGTADAGVVDVRVKGRR